MAPRFLLPLVAVTLLAAGCNRESSAAADASAALGSDGSMVLRMGNGSEPQDLDPQAVTGVTEHHIIAALFEGLVSPDPEDLSPEPGLAETWEISDDGLVYTFHLRAGLQWSDGSPLTANDFLRSYQRMLSPTFAADYAYLIYDYVRNAKEYYDGTITDFSEVGFAAPDSRTLIVTLKQPTPYLLSILATHYAWTPVPVDVIARHGDVYQKHTAWTRVGNLVGSGPFVLTEWLPDQKIVVERNPRYWDADAVKLDAIEFHAVNDEATEERMFRTGLLDMTYSLPLSKIPVYREESPDLLRIEPYLGIYYYMFNVARPPLDDVRVRRALALAIDREAIVQNVTRGDQIPAYAVSYPGTAGYAPRARLEGNIAEAQRLLAEAGFPGGQGMPPIELLYNTLEAHRTIAAAIQEMWRRNLGVELRLVNQEWKVYLDMTSEHDFDLARGGWIADYLDPNPFLEIWRTGNGNNHTNWSNAEYDRLFEQSLAIADRDARYATLQRLDEILIEDMPIIPIYHYTRVYAVSPRVQGVHANLLDIHPYKYVAMEAWQ